MSELRNLADQKIDAERRKLLASLHGSIEALKAKHSAAGMLMSGHTLVEITNIYSRALESLRDTIITQYRWAISQALLSTQTFAEDLIGAGREQVAVLLSPCIDGIRGEGRNISAPPNAITECCDKLNEKNEEICEDVKLALRSTFAELKRNRVRGIGWSVTGWISKFVGGSPKA